MGAATDGYESVLDLPSYRDLLGQLRVSKTVTRFIARDQRAKVLEVERQLLEMARAIDRFYELLGERHWVFHELLPISEMSTILRGTPADAERALIEVYSDGKRLQWWVLRISRLPEMRAREALLRSALNDYEAGRYVASTLTLLTVMDGFVNDVDKSLRRGMHAREPHEMQAWDSVVGHHKGLTNVMPVFRRSFKATREEEVHELYRNGILHGNLPNFGNSVVATKAWNYIFAVADWSESLRKRDEPKPVPPTFTEILDKVAAVQRDKAALAEWSSSELAAGSPGWDEDDLVTAAHRFFAAWRARNYGHMTSSLQANSPIRRKGSAPRVMRDLYSPYNLESFALERVHYVAAAIGVVTARLQVSGSEQASESRWLYQDADGNSRIQGLQAGQWVRVLDGPEGFI